MAITTGSRIAVTLKMLMSSQTIMQVWTYNVLEIVGTPTAAHYGQAWWNHVKATYRALSAVGLGSVFQSVLVTELGNPTGEYGEFGIPLAEKAGTRAAPADADVMPIFVAAGVRLNVPARVTRPGQKRFPFLTQTDVVLNDLQSQFTTLLTSHMDVMIANMTLGAPAAGVVLVPAVVGLNADGTIRGSQVTTSYTINPQVTSQVSRKVGHGF